MDNVPSVTGNPLPNHVGPKIDVVMEDSILRVKTKVDQVKATMKEMHEVLVKVGAILKKEITKEGKKKQGCFCNYHATCASHII